MSTIPSTKNHHEIVFVEFELHTYTLLLYVECSKQDTTGEKSFEASDAVLKGRYVQIAPGFTLPSAAADIL